MSLSHPKSTVLAIENLIDHINEPQFISAVGKAVGQISDLGLSQKIDTVNMAVDVFANKNMSRLIECLTNNHNPEEVALIICEIMIATSWNCLRDPNLSSQFAAFASMPKQINDTPSASA